ncbi:MAG: serine/threonine protein kinase [Armatimonadetes bacterium]|nr:serine/threonine protein kinase [Armatimonadota bacterium]
MAVLLDKPIYARIGDYVLVRVIGRGTHYTLFQAMDPRVGRMVVVKILHASSAPGTSPLESADPNASPTPEAAREPAHVLEARLQREAQALARLSHPNILAIHDTGEWEGHLFLVMEYLHGHALRQHLDLGPLPLEEIVDIMEQVAAAVDAVHDQGILHRDIRPSSVMILHDGRVKLMDFGLARQPGDTTVTLMGALVGEPAYMAPEQLRNRPASQESDLWALGVLLYEMLAGHPPFQGANFPLVAHQIVMGSPAPVPGVSEAVQAVVDRALEKEPGKRYRRAGEMVEALHKAIKTSSMPTPYSSSILTLSRREPRGRGRVVAAVGLGLVAAAVIGAHLAGHAPEASRPGATAAAATRSALPLAPIEQASPGPVPAAVPAASSNPSPPGRDAARTLPPTKRHPRRQ